MQQHARFGELEQRRRARRETAAGTQIIEAVERGLHRPGAEQDREGLRQQHRALVVTEAPNDVEPKLDVTDRFARVFLTERDPEVGGGVPRVAQLPGALREGERGAQLGATAPHVALALQRETSREPQPHGAAAIRLRAARDERLGACEQRARGGPLAACRVDRDDVRKEDFEERRLGAVQRSFVGAGGRRARELCARVLEPRLHAEQGDLADRNPERRRQPLRIIIDLAEQPRRAAQPLRRATVIAQEARRLGGDDVQ